MSTTVVDIYNWALAAIGNRSRIQSPTEASIEAEKCTLFYENVRDQVLRSAPWDCARAQRRLALSAERNDNEVWTSADPSPNYRYAYALPTNFLWPRFLSTYEKFELGVNDKDERVLYTNAINPILIYTKKQPRTDVWDPDLAAAIAFALAAHICASLTGSNDKVRLVTAQALDKIVTARQNSANAPQAATETVPEWIAARGYGQASPASIFVYPAADFAFGGLSSATYR